MLALCSHARVVSAEHVVAMVAHAFSIVLGLGVRATVDILLFPAFIRFLFLLLGLLFFFFLLLAPFYRLYLLF